MQSLVYTGPKKLEWMEVPTPQLQEPDDVLVRPIVSSTCDLDRRIVAGAAPFTPPFAIGHEAIGEVIEVGNEASGLEPGDLVVVPWHVSCGQCQSCARRMPGACLSVPRLASYGNPVGGLWGGLFDEVVRVPWAQANLVVLPRAVDPVLAASAADNMTDAYRAVAPTLLADPSSSVLIVGGTASLGLLTIACVQALTETQPTYVDTHPGRCGLAESYGARTIFGSAYPERVEGDFDLVVDVSADVSGLRCAMLSARPGGTCVVRSIYFGDIPLPFFELYASGITLLTGPPHASPSAHEVLALLEGQRLDPAPSLAGPYPHDEAVDVLTDPPPGKPQFIRPRLLNRAC